MAWRRHQTERVTPEEAHAAMPVLQDLAADFWYFVTSCVQTLDEHEHDPELSLSKPFPRYPYLKDLALDLQKLPVLKKLQILKSRQLIISWLLISYVSWRTLFHNGNRVLWLTIKEDDSFKMKRRLVHVLDHLPDIVRVLLDRRTVDNAGEIEFQGGSSALFLPSSQNPGRSMTATDIILDEHAFHPHAENMYAAIKPTVSGGGCVVSNSTPNGVGNLFHSLVMDARKGVGHPQWNGYHYREVPWQDHPDRDDGWYEETTRDLPARKKAQEYDLDFIQSGSPVFDSSYLKLKTEPVQVQLGEKEIPQAIRAMIKRAAKLGTADSPFLIGCDVGEGVDGGDLSVATVLEAATLRQVFTIAGVWRPDVFARKIKLLSAYFPGIIGVEKNGPGGTVILELERLGLADRLYRHREWDQRGRMKTKLGWVTSGKSKPVMIDRLEVALRLGQLPLSDIATKDECTVYEYKDSSTEHSGAPSGYHDDHVMALAIALAISGSAGAIVESVG